MRTKSIAVGTLIGAFSTVLLVCGCNSGGGATEGPKTSSTLSASGGGSGGGAAAGTVNSQGSTFIQVFLSKAFDEYKNKTGFFINYTGGGSSQGIKGVSEGVIPFGASDAPMNDKELAKAGKKILNLPLVLGGIPIVYNVPGVKTGLKLDGPTLADIFMFKITKWNDPKIAALNTDLKLPSTPISVQVRADGSGTTYVVSDFLSKVSPDWKTKMGVNKILNWDTKAQKWKGSEGVATNTKSTPGSISYVELSWATKSGLDYAAIKNSAGKFVLPDAKSVTAAAAASPLPPDFRGSIVNAAGADAYPISTYSYGLVPEDLASSDHGKDVVGALKYVVGDAQSFAEGLNYAPLPADVAKKVSAALDTVKVK